MRPTIRLFGFCTLALLGGCGELPAQLTFDQQELQLGTANDSSGANAVLAVTNHGQTGATILTQIVGAPELTIAADGCRGHKLGHDERCTITVNLRSDVAGTYKATLAVEYLGGGNEIPVEGTVSAAKLELVPDDHFDVAIGQTDTTLVAVRNLGGARSGPVHLDLDSGSLVNNQCEGRTVQGGGSCFVTLSYGGSASTGTVHATMVATGTPGGQTSKTIALNTIPLQVDNVAGVLLPAPDALERTVKVHNAGKDAVLWSGVDLEMVNSTAAGTCLVAHDPCTGTSLAADGSCSMTVRCLAAPTSWQDGVITLRTTEGVIVGKSKIHLYGAQTRIGVVYAGTGHGTVRLVANSSFDFQSTTTPDGLAAGSQNVNGTYTLYADVQSDSVIAGWSGCQQSADDPNACDVSIELSRDLHVTATFNLR